MTIEDYVQVRLSFRPNPDWMRFSVGGCKSPAEGNILVVMEVLESDGKLFRRTVTKLYFQV